MGGNTTAQNKKYDRIAAAVRLILLAGLVGTVVFIFSNSMQVGSASSTASGRVLHILQSALSSLGQPELAARITEKMVRKSAHFCEYMLEGFLLLLCFHAYTRKPVRHISWPVLLGLLTALCDETIQMFTYGRDSRVTDVWIDFAGVLTGILLALILAGIQLAYRSRRRGSDASH